MSSIWTRMKTVRRVFTKYERELAIGVVACRKTYYEEEGMKKGFLKTTQLLMEYEQDLEIDLVA